MSGHPLFRIELLDPARHRREEFDCGVAALNKYLKTQARKDMAETYCSVTDSR